MLDLSDRSAKVAKSQTITNVEPLKPSNNTLVPFLCSSHYFLISSSTSIYRRKYRRKFQYYYLKLRKDPQVSTGDSNDSGYNLAALLLLYRSLYLIINPERGFLETGNNTLKVILPVVDVETLSTSNS